MYTNSISGSSNANQMYNLMKQISSAKRINSAADDAAGLAIANKLGTQQTIYSTTNKNITDSKSFLSTAEGGLTGVTDSLQRIRELGMQASNGTYSKEDRAAIQSEITQLKDQIDSVSKSTTYNGLSTLNGNSYSLSGSSTSSSFDTSTKALGISDFDVTGKFDLNAVDEAIKKVSNMRGDAGAASNAMTHEINANSIAEINILDAKSRIEDADMSRLIMNLKQSQIINRGGMFAQRQSQATMNANAGRVIDMLV